MSSTLHSIHNYKESEGRESQSDPTAFAPLWDVNNASFDNLWPFCIWVRRSRQKPQAAALERLEEQEHWGKNEKKSSEWGRKGTN